MRVRRAFPVVPPRARRGAYRVEVRLYQCASEPCYYAMGLFEKGGEDGWVPVQVPLLRR